MKMINRDTDYAVRALGFISQHKEKLVSAAEMVKCLKIPRPFLRKILQRLHQEGVLDAQKGLSGGFFLTAPAEKIYLMDLIRVFQGGLKLNECLFKKKACPDRPTCLLRQRINEIEAYAVSVLKPVSIAELLGKKSYYGKKKNHKN